MPQSLTTLQSTALGPVLTVSGVSPTVAVTTTAYPGSATAANPAGGETITVTGTGFNAGVKVYVGSTICTTTYVSATSLTFVSPANSVGSYVLYVYNTDGTNGASPAGITYSAIPVWVTASGALAPATVDASYSTSVSATGDTIVYSVTTGSLPTGLSLNASTGAITGTPTVVATSNFDITATDAQNQAVARSFSIAVTAVILVDFKLWAGGGGGTAADGYGGGSGGFVAGTLAVNPGAVLKVVVGAGGSAGVGGKAGGGGGYCGVFLTSVSHANALLIAGAGSSGARGGSAGVGGGGSTGQAGLGTGGFGGTQLAGGASQGTTPGTAGSALQGGKGQGGPSGGAVYGGGPDGGGDNATATPGSGGAGYYGGGGAGNSGGPNYGGSGGGGSSYLGTATSTTNTVGNNGSTGTGGAAVNSGDAQYQANTNKGGNGGLAGGPAAGGNGACVYRVNGGSWIVLSYTGADQTITVTV
jgi:hypothetical protein